MSSFLGILGAILVLSVLILVHELGHFGVARAVGIQVDEFSIFMGPKLWSKEHKGILYSVRLLPIGGYCRFRGEDEDDPDPAAFNNQPVWKRFLTTLAGATMNFVAAYVLAVLLLGVIGQPVATSAVGEVTESMPAYEAGIQTGDVIVAIDGAQVATPGEITERITAAGENEVLISVQRGDAILDLAMTPVYDSELERTRVGIVFGTENQRSGWASFGQAGKFCVETTVTMVQDLFQLLTGKYGADDMMGPVGIVSMVSQTAQSGMRNLMMLAMLISINVGIVNLLPLPALDGSRLIFMIIEAVRGKPFPRKWEAVVHFVGLMCLFALMIFITFNDIARIVRM